MRRTSRLQEILLIFAFYVFLHSKCILEFQNYNMISRSGMLLVIKWQLEPCLNEVAACAMSRGAPIMFIPTWSLLVETLKQTYLS